MFHVTEKAHYVQHIGDDVAESLFNPAYGWTYQDEDYMGRVAATVRACTRARGPLRVSLAFVLRYRTHMHVRWARLRSFA